MSGEAKPMPVASALRDEVFALASSVCDGNSTADEMKRLNMLLGTSHLARDIYREAIGLHALQDIIPGVQPDDCRIAIAALRAAGAERVTFAEVLESEALYGKCSMKWQLAEAYKDAEAKIEALGLDANHFFLLSLRGDFLLLPRGARRVV